MRVLVIDNIDSFVYNLVQYAGICGAHVSVLKNDAEFQKIKDQISMGVDRIIISPGPKRPQDAGISNKIIMEYGAKIPTLGVCLGHQCIGHVFGAKIIHAPKIMHGKKSMIKHDGRGLFRGVPNPFTAVRYHSLVIDPSDIPLELDVCATSEDGQIMAVRHKKLPIHGVQFHPESIGTENGMALIRNFLGDSP